MPSPPWSGRPPHASAEEDTGPVGPFPPARSAPSGTSAPSAVVVGRTEQQPPPRLGAAPVGPSAPHRVEAEGPGSVLRLVVPLAVGLGFAVALGVLGRLHTPGTIAVDVAGFSGPRYVKAWLTTLAALLAVVQVVSALSMWGRFGLPSPPWAAVAHRWSGRLAVLVTVPVAVHCLFVFGFEYDQPRVLAHSLAGCLFYGLFVAKMLALPRRGTPGWTTPVLGGVVFTALAALWLTSALWLFGLQGVHL